MKTLIDLYIQPQTFRHGELNVPLREAQITVGFYYRQQETKIVTIFYYLLKTNY